MGSTKKSMHDYDEHLNLLHRTHNAHSYAHPYPRKEGLSITNSISRHVLSILMLNVFARVVARSVQKIVFANAYQLFFREGARKKSATEKG